MTVSAFGSGTETPALGTFTVTIASPCVVTYNSHGLAAGDKVMFATTGALPTGLAVATWYFVLSTDLSSNTFKIAATDGGSAINTSGSQSGTHSLISENFAANVNQAGTYVFETDMNALASGDVFELRVYKMILTGGTARPWIYQRFAGAQPADDLIATSIPVSNELTDTNSIRCSITQTKGTARAIPWKVLKHA